ncbi:MAG: methyltransferase, partial [Elusimicrobiota bacterium]
MTLPIVRLDVPPADWSALVRPLRRAGYDFNSLRDALKLPRTLDAFVHGWDDRSFPRVAARLRRLRPRTPIERMAAAVFLSRPAPAAQWRRLFRPAELSFLRRTGLLAQDGAPSGQWVFSMAVCPFRGFFFLVDSLPRMRQLGWRADDLPPDAVYFLGPETLLLAQEVRRTACRSAVDLCTGSGVHAVLASMHARTVWAVDVSSRAVDVARANCALNGAGNVRVVRGDLWDAVPRGLLFDLVVSNPPILRAPGLRRLWADGGPDGNELVRRILARLPGRMTSRGTCQMTAARGVVRWLSSRPALRGFECRWSPYPKLVSGNSGFLELRRRARLPSQGAA